MVLAQSCDAVTRVLANILVAPLPNLLFVCFTSVHGGYYLIGNRNLMKN